MILRRPPRARSHRKTGGTNRDSASAAMVSSVGERTATVGARAAVVGALEEVDLLLG